MNHAIYQYIGLDLGRQVDHSAIAVIAQSRGDLILKHLRRIPIGTDYLDVIDEVQSAIRFLGAPRRPSTRRPRVFLALDAAGPGQLAMEIFRNSGSGARIVPVCITGGAAENMLRGGICAVPRQALIANLCALLQSGRLGFSSQLYWVRELMRELSSLRVDGRQANHDDLVMALGLAAWLAIRGFPELTEIPRAA